MRYPLYRIEHPYPARAMRRYPTWVTAFDFFVWLAVFGYIALTQFSLWPIAIGVVITWLAWWLVQTQIHCPECGQRLAARGEMDIHDADHMFYDCHECRITFDPKFSEPADSGFDSSSEE